MRIFETTIDGLKYQFVCRSENTRTGFRHLCSPLISGVQYDTQKCTYINRTYEVYTYQSVLHKTVDSLKLPEKTKEKLKSDFYEQR